MATNDYNLTRIEIVKAALRRLGNTRPDATAISQATEALLLLTREIDEEGRWYFAISNTETSLTLVTSQRSYATGATATTIATNIVDLENVQIYTGSAPSIVYDPPMRLLSKDEALATWNREGTGRPYECYLEKGLTAAAHKLHFFPTPDSAYTVKYNYQRSLAEQDSSTDSPDVPLHAVNMLKKRLSHELSAEYGVDPNVYQILKNESDEAWARFLARNSEKVSPTTIRTEFF